MTVDTEIEIGPELARNLSLSVAAIFLVTLVTLGDAVLSSTVIATVVFTLVDVVGMMYFAGLPIDQTAFICLVIIVGLSIDYSLHMAHAFKVAAGNIARNDKIMKVC